MCIAMDALRNFAQHRLSWDENGPMIPGIDGPNLLKVLMRTPIGKRGLVRVSFDQSQHEDISSKLWSTVCDRRSLSSMMLSQ